MIITVYFNERGYRMTTPKDDSKFIYDLPDEIVNNAVMLYMHRWVVLNDILTAIDEMNITSYSKDLILHTDSRLIEELCGELTPDNHFAKDSLRYFIEKDYVKFRRVTFNKCASTTINSRLNESISERSGTT